MASWLREQPMDRPPTSLSVVGPSGSLTIDLDRRGGGGVRVHFEAAFERETLLESESKREAAQRRKVRVLDHRAPLVIEKAGRRHADA